MHSWKASLTPEMLTNPTNWRWKCVNCGAVEYFSVDELEKRRHMKIKEHGAKAMTCKEYQVYNVLYA